MKYLAPQSFARASSGRIPLLIADWAMLNTWKWRAGLMNI